MMIGPSMHYDEIDVTISSGYQDFLKALHDEKLWLSWCEGVSLRRWKLTYWPSRMLSNAELDWMESWLTNRWEHYKRQSAEVWVSPIEGD